MNLRTTERLIGASLLGILSVGLLAGCATDADRVDENLKQRAEAFDVQRRISVQNNITDKVMMTIEGLCSFEQPTSRRVEIICRIGPDEYVKDVAFLGDNATALIEQASEDATKNVSKYHYVVNIKPENVIPDFNVSLGER